MKLWIKRIVKVTAIIFVSWFIGWAMGYSQGEASVQTQAQTAAKEEISSDAILNLVNDERTKVGVARLSTNSFLMQSAEAKCKDMVDNHYYDHINPTTGKHGYDYIDDFYPKERGRLQLKARNENLDQYERHGDDLTNVAFVNDWINSPGHKMTMLDPEYTDTGIAYCEPDGHPTVVQQFASFWSVSY